MKDTNGRSFNMIKRGLLALMFGLAALFACSAMVVEAADFDLELESHKIINNYWNMTEALYILQEYPFKSPEVGNLERDYIEKARSYRTSCEAFNDEIVNHMREGSAERLFTFSNIYQAQSDIKKRAFDPAVKMIVEKITADSLNGDGALILLIPEKHRDSMLEDYFPGYGYADPNYLYRKGKEVRRELLHAYWKTEQKTIETTNYMEMTIAVELMASLEAQVDFLKILKLFEIEINGKLVAAAKVSFQVRTALVTTCQRKYERNKIWFELYHASKHYFWEPIWELCGETYNFFEEPSGEEVVIGSEIVPPPPIPPVDEDNKDIGDGYEQASLW